MFEKNYGFRYFASGWKGSRDGYSDCVYCRGDGMIESISKNIKTGELIVSYVVCRSCKSRRDFEEVNK